MERIASGDKCNGGVDRIMENAHVQILSPLLESSRRCEDLTARFYSDLSFGRTLPSQAKFSTWIFTIARNLPD